MHPKPFTRPTRAGLQRRQRGISVIEIGVTTAITALLVGAAAPSFTAGVERRTIDGVLTQLETDLQFARSQAAARSQSVRISFQADGAGSCYIVHTGSAADDCHCDAQGQALCDDPVQALRVAFVPAQRAVRLASNAHSMVFDATRHTVTPTATITVSGREGRAVRQIVNIVGRTRTCSPGASVPGHKAC